MKEIKVSGYSVCLSDNLKKLMDRLRKKSVSQTVILVDENTRACCLPLLFDAAPGFSESFILEIPSGENFKTINTCAHLWEQLLENGIDREALVLNLGGGVIGDMGGFVASTYKRGIDFVNLPTTLLSQVDATIGGKLGVDFCGAKNAIGLFANPTGVYIYPGFLSTLPESELMSGFAEMIKHALISSVRHWNGITETAVKTKNMEALIHTSLLVKKKVVEADPFEKNLRKTLNFGHTLGHAFESAALQKDIPLLHGHAVAMGMAGEVYLSGKRCGMSNAQVKEITDFIFMHYGKYFPSPEKISWQKWIKHDKKNANGNLNFTLLKSIGKPLINQYVDMKEVSESVDFIKDRL